MARGGGGLGARAKRRMLIARPWLAELPFVAAPHGPNFLLWLEALLDSLSATGLSYPDLGEMISIVDGFVRGTSDTAISLSRARGISTDERARCSARSSGRLSAPNARR